MSNASGSTGLTDDVVTVEASQGALHRPPSEPSVGIPTFAPVETVHGITNFLGKVMTTLIAQK